MQLCIVRLACLLLAVATSHGIAIKESAAVKESAALQASHGVNSTVESSHGAGRDPTDKEVVLATVKRMCFHCIRGCLHGRAACEQCVRGCVPLSIAT